MARSRWSAQDKLNSNFGGWLVFSHNAFSGLFFLLHNKSFAYLLQFLTLCSWGISTCEKWAYTSVCVTSAISLALFLFAYLFFFTIQGCFILTYLIVLDACLICNERKQEKIWVAGADLGGVGKPQSEYIV